jgi:hypothetical protein
MPTTCPAHLSLLTSINMELYEIIYNKLVLPWGGVCPHPASNLGTIFCWLSGTIAYLMFLQLPRTSEGRLHARCRGDNIAVNVDWIC